MINTIADLNLRVNENGIHFAMQSAREREKQRELVVWKRRSSIQIHNRFIENLLYGSRSIAPFLHFLNCLIQQRELLFWYKNAIYTVNFLRIVCAHTRMKCVCVCVCTELLSREFALDLLWLIDEQFYQNQPKTDSHINSNVSSICNSISINIKSNGPKTIFAICFSHSIFLSFHFVVVCDVWCFICTSLTSLCFCGSCARFGRIVATMQNIIVICVALSQFISSLLLASDMQREFTVFSLCCFSGCAWHFPYPTISFTCTFCTRPSLKIVLSFTHFHVFISCYVN